MGMRVKRQEPKRRHRTKVNEATKHGHIHKHNPTWKPKKDPIDLDKNKAKTHAYYRRFGQIHPDRKRLMRIKEIRNEQRASNKSKSPSS